MDVRQMREEATRRINQTIPGPAILLSFPTRGIDRAGWKMLYRLSRISARESRKAFDAMLLHGVAFTKITADGSQHVPTDQVLTQEPLGEPYSTILNKNLWDLYDLQE